MKLLQAFLKTFLVILRGEINATCDHCRGIIAIDLERGCVLHSCAANKSYRVGSILPYSEVERRR
jgi:hypothetical protein